MKLFNKTIDRQLFKQYPLGSDLSKQEVVAKIFNPSGAGSWYILNSDPNDPDYLWAIVDLGYGAEVGSVSRSDLETYRGRFGLGFERDLSFDTVNAEELYEGLRQGKFYGKGGNLSRDRKFLNHSQEWEVEYSKGKNRHGYGSASFADGGSLEDVLKQDVSFLRFDSHRAYDSFKRLDIPHLQVHDYDFNHYSIIKTENLEKVLSSVKKGIRVVKKKFTVDEIGYDYKGRTTFADGGEVSFIEYKDSEIIYEPNYDKYYANDVEFDSLKEAQEFIDSGEIDPIIRDAYSKGMFADGGSVNVGYNVFNYTDNIYATDEVFKTKALANKFIKEFRSRFSNQGYYRDNRMNKINIQDIDLLAIPSDFNPFKKFADGGGVSNDVQVKNFSDLQQGDVVRRRDKLGTTIFVVNGKPKQSTGYKNEYNVLVTCIVSNDNYYKPFEEYNITSVIKYGKLGNIDYIGKWSYDNKVDYSLYLPKSNKKMAYGGEIEVVYERRADFKKKPIKLLLLNKGREQKGYTFSGKDQVAVLDNYNRNKQEDLEKLWNLKGYETKYADGGSLGNYDVVIDGDWDEPKKFKTFSLAKKWIYQNVKNYESLELVDPYGDTIFVEGNSTKEDLDWLFSNDEVSSFADGGELNDFSDNQRMIMNQNVQLEHHHEELEDILEDKIEVPAWVVAKMATATDSVSAITHYLDGQKELMEDENEEDEDEEDEDDKVKNYKVVEPINVSAGTKAEMTKKFTNDAFGNIKGFLKGIEGIDLREDYTFDYKDEQFEIEPIINSDENGVSNAVFTIFDGDGEEQGEMTYSRNDGKQKFTANSELFGWNNSKFEDGGYFDGAIPKTSTYMSNYAKGGKVPILIPNVGTIETFMLKSMLIKNPDVKSILNDKEFEFLKNENTDAIGVSGKPFNFIITDGNQEIEFDLKKNVVVKHLKEVRDKIKSYYSENYAKGGEIAKAEVFGLSRNVMGTTNIEMKITGMRKAQDFIVYPIGKDDSDKIITIQSETRIGKIDLSSGRGLMSQSHSNGAYFVHFQMDKLTPFTVSESDLENIKTQIFKTAGANVGTRGIVSDNSGASRLFADGGNFDKPFDVAYKTKSGSAMVAKRIMAKNEEEAKEKLEKQMRASSTFDKVFMTYPSFADGGALYTNQYFGKGYEDDAIAELKKALPNHDFKKGKNSIVIDNGKFIIHLDLGRYGFIKAYSKEGSEGGVSVTRISDAVDFIKDNQHFSFAEGGRTNRILKEGDVVKFKTVLEGENPKSRYVVLEIAYDSEPQRALIQILGSNFSIVPTEKVRISDLEFVSESKYANGGSFEKVKWQDVEIGDSARVKELNRMGLIAKTYGRKFHLKFPNGTEKTFDATDLEFFKLEKDEYEMDDNNNFAKGGSFEELLPKYKLLKLLKSKNFKSFDSSEIEEINYEYETENPFDKSFVLQIEADPCLITVDKSIDGFEVRIGRNTNWYGGFSFASWEYVFEIPKLTYEDFEIGLKKAMNDKNITLYSKYGTGNVDSIYFNGTIEDAIKFAKKNGYEFKNSEYFYNASLPTYKDVRILKIGRFTEAQIKKLGGIKSLILENGGNLSKYILKADIKTVTVKRNGKEVTYKGADVLNGANVLAKGGDISSKANYIPKRDVVEVELKDGSKVKPVNGYWVKKGAEAIGAETTTTSSSNAQPKINTTEIRKDARGNWRAETNIDNFNGYDWRISTLKTYTGNLVSSAQGGKTEATGTKGIVMFKYTMYEDPNHTLEVSKPKRLTDKTVSEQHDKALAKFKKYMETGMFKGGGKISNFDKLSAKVAKEYEGKPVKSQYQEEYGKYYSKEEAQEVGDKVAGKVKAMQTDKKILGGLFGKSKESSGETKKSIPNLAKKQVTLKSGDVVQVFSQDGDKIEVLNLEKMSSGVRPHTINISEVDTTSYKLGGTTSKKSNSGIETLKQANELAKKIRKEDESWLDAKKRAFALLKQ